MSRLRITVRKKMHFPDLQASYGKDGTFGICTAFEEGQAFETADSKPDGFRSWAWADIQRDVMMVLFGQGFPWVKQPETAISCCTDGFRPVTFKVERVEE